MSKTTIVNEARRQVVDVNTGEILQEERSIGTKTIHKQEPPYIKLYLEDILYMSDMPKSLSGLTYSLATRAQYANKEDGLCVFLPTYVKQQILQECGWDKMQSLNNALNKLVNGKILKRLGVGAYQLNPYFFGKGEWKDIDNIRMTWDYNEIKGKTFSTSFRYKSDNDGQYTMEFEDDERETSTDTLRNVI